MKKQIAGLSLLMAGFVTTTAYAASVDFTQSQKDAIGKIAAQYIVDHPEVLLEASQKLQQQQRDAQEKTMTAAVLKNQEALLHTKTTPRAGSSDAKVAVIEFFDYECVFCHRVAPEVHKLMDKNKDIAFIFQEFPIFASRFEGSKFGAEAGFAIYNLYGSDAYMQYHQALFEGKNANRDEGKLTKADIMAVIKEIKGVDVTKVEDYMRSTSPALIEASMKLGSQIGLQGTPGFIIMPTTGATEKNIVVIPGYVGYETLQKAVDQVENSLS
ncbi:MAG: DsbA family protein [Francisellaceae bacterium]